MASTCRCGRAVYLSTLRGLDTASGRLHTPEPAGFCSGCDRAEVRCTCAPLERPRTAWDDVARFHNGQVAKLMQATVARVEACGPGWEVVGIRSDVWVAHAPARLAHRQPGRSRVVKADSADELVRRVRELEGLDPEPDAPKQAVLL